MPKNPRALSKFDKFKKEAGADSQKKPKDVEGTSSDSKPTFSEHEYGRPVAGSLSELRGQKANLHVFKEIFELCKIIYSEGFPLSEERSELKVILFGDLFSIYTHISNKVVGILLRARKFQLIDFEGEMLYQRRDDDEPIFMIKSINEIRESLELKEHEVSSKMSSNPKPTTVLQDNVHGK